MMQGKTEVSISELAQACDSESMSAIYRHPDVSSIREVEIKDDDTADSNPTDNPKLIVGGATLLLRHWRVLATCHGDGVIKGLCILECSTLDCK